MPDISCTSYAPGHHVHFIQVRMSWDKPAEAEAVELIAVNGNWFDVLIGGEPRRGWSHDAQQVEDFFARAAHSDSPLSFPDPAEAAAKGREEFLKVHHDDTYRGQLNWHRASGGALTVNHGDGTRGMLSVCWGEPDECHVHVRRHADSVTVS